MSRINRFLGMIKTVNIQMSPVTAANGLLMGGGLWHATHKQNTRFTEVICAVVVPPIYVGYQFMQHTDDIMKEIASDKKRLDKEKI
jgi:hypothetical protein